jgi:hypothetical protein
MTATGTSLDSGLTVARADRHGARILANRIVRTYRTLRYHLSEVRNFLRHPLRLDLVPAEGPGLVVILYGIPYGDWNRMLANRALWESLKVVSKVRRVPAFWPLWPWRADRTVLIPMKSEHAALAPPRYRGLRPAKDALAVLDNKEAFQSYMERNGLADFCPARYESADRAIYPCVVKRLDLSGSVGVEVATSHAHLDEILRSPVFALRPYILQALVSGTVEYATFCVCDRGRILWHWTFASTMTGPAVIKNEDNDKNRQLVVAAPEVLQQFEKVLTPLAYCGPCIVNYKFAADGRVQIFEINPRFGGSLLQPPQTDRLREALGHIIGG